MRLVQTLRLSAAVAGCSWCNDMPGSGRLAERDLLALASSVAAEAGGLDAGPSRFYKALRALASRRAGLLRAGIRSRPRAPPASE